FDLLLTTSPSAMIYATIDECRARMQADGERLLAAACATARRARAGVERIEGLRVLGDEVIIGHPSVLMRDPLKPLIDLSGAHAARGVLRPVGDGRRGGGGRPYRGRVRGSVPAGHSGARAGRGGRRGAAGAAAAGGVAGHADRLCGGSAPGQPQGGGGLTLVPEAGGSAVACISTPATTTAPPSRIPAEGRSDTTSHTQRGPRTTSSSVMVAISAAGISRAPTDSSASPRPIWPAPSRTSRTRFRRSTVPGWANGTANTKISTWARQVAGAIEMFR